MQDKKTRLKKNKSQSKKWKRSWRSSGLNMSFKPIWPEGIRPPMRSFLRCLVDILAKYALLKRNSLSLSNKLRSTFDLSNARRIKLQMSSRYARRTGS